MKVLNQNEMDQILGELQQWRGAMLQELLASSNQLGLGLYHQGQMQWLWLDMHPQRPMMLALKSPPAIRKVVTPVLLFLRAHARSRVLSEVRPGAGRTVELDFGRGEQACTLEVRLFPHGQNIIARYEEQKISWLKIKPLVPGVAAHQSESVRSWQQIGEQWLALKKAPAPADAGALRRQWEQKIERKQKALAEIQAALQAPTPWAEMGEFLKIHSDAQWPETWRSHYDAQKSASENMQTFFAKAKQQAAKLAGTRHRMAMLESEIAELKQQLAGDHLSLLPPADRPVRSSKPNFAARMRTAHSSLGLVLWVGKSAKDNLTLLREARPFDLWLHLRDYPGAHGIIRREKNQVVPREQLEELSRALIKLSLSGKLLSDRGGSFEVICTECRYVRPIKSNKNKTHLGHVQYSHEQVLRVRVE